jgi:hypothetical protein
MSFSEVMKIHSEFFNWDGLSWNPTVPWEFICETFDSDKWNWGGISTHPELTWEFVCNHPDREPEHQQWDWIALSHHPNITWEIISSNLDKPWDWTTISEKNPNITPEIVNSTVDNPSLHQKWNWYKLEERFEKPVLVRPQYMRTEVFEFPKHVPDDKTWNFIIAQTDVNWDWVSISAHPNITPEIVKANPNLSWLWTELCKNPNFVDVPEARLHPRWSWNAFSWNPKITWEIVSSNLDRDWDWEGLSYNLQFESPKLYAD